MFKVVVCLEMDDFFGEEIQFHLSSLFQQIATSVTQHPLRSARREFKTSRTSTIHPTSSSLPDLTILFLSRWKVSFPQFNIHLRLLFSLSSPNELRTSLVFFQDFLPRSTMFHLLQIEFHQLTLLQNRTF
ncbi:hypothetical protein AVEN_272006-1 [Araneus ventricosus]|uniref:Uncharacterized protein n=1 Tax=Araneus ventricosus TaxID=182803 RepID=A0A4Y2HIC2_ARAVE|nr:hypothetical protein AVEN_272006-1 [Araneus ventricosus]